MELCAKHQGDIKYLVLKPNSVKLACIECRDELLIDGQPPDTCLLLTKILKIPEVLLSKINIEPLFKTFFSKILLVSSEDLNNSRNQWIKVFEEIKASLDQMIKETNTFFDHLSQNLIKYRTELRNIIKFETFEQHIKANLNFQTFDQVSSIIIYRQRQETTIQIEQKIQDYINQIQQGSNDENRQSIKALIKDYKNTVMNSKFPSSGEIFNQLQKQFERFQSAVQDKFKLANPTQSSLLSDINFQNIRTRINQQQNSAYSLIYQGSIDGMNTITFWNKIQKKSNLLMLMKAKNNQCVFGGYSPCQWLKTPQAQQIPDLSGTSFLFIQNPSQQIYYYPIKNEFKGQAITVNQNYGPIFGKPDLLISNDFKDGFFNLGQHYFRDINENYQSFFLGPKLEEIIECEVFEL